MRSPIDTTVWVKSTVRCHHIGKHRLTVFLNSTPSKNVDKSNTSFRFVCLKFESNVLQFLTPLIKITSFTTNLSLFIGLCTIILAHILRAENLIREADIIRAQFQMHLLLKINNFCSSFFRMVWCGRFKNLSIQLHTTLMPRESKLCFPRQLGSNQS